MGQGVVQGFSCTELFYIFGQVTGICQMSEILKKTELLGKFPLNHYSD